MKHFFNAFAKFAEFSGRATRTEYWMFVLIYFIISILLVALDLALGTIALEVLFGLASIVPSISLTARRLHDTGRSGWWQLIAIIPIIGIIILFVFMVLTSHERNKHGPNRSFA